MLGFVDQGAEQNMISDPEIMKAEQRMLAFYVSIVRDRAFYVTVYRDLSDFPKI